MPRKKKNAETAAVEAAAVETAVVETVPAPAAEEAPKKRGRKSAEKKTETVSAAEEAPKKRTRKPAEKKTETAPAAEETPKKRSRKPTEKKAANENVVIQFMGAAVSASELISKAKADCGVESPKTVDVYVKPEENMVYYVVDGVTGEFALA